MNWRRAIFWILVAATGAVYALMLTWSLPKIAVAAGGLAPFDMRPTGYGHDEALAFVRALDPATLGFYLGTQHRLDLLFPALLGIVLVAAFYKLAPRWLRLPSALLALSTTLADWHENWWVDILLRHRPEAISPELVATASTATVVKSILVTAAMILLLILLIRRYVFRRGRSDA